MAGYSFDPPLARVWVSGADAEAGLLALPARAAKGKACDAVPRGVCFLRLLRQPTAVPGKGRLGHMSRRHATLQVTDGFSDGTGAGVGTRWG